MRRPEDFTQMEYPFGGMSTDLAQRSGLLPRDMRSHIIGHPGAYNPSERRSAQRAEQAIRRNARENRGLERQGLADLLKYQDRERV